MQTVTRIRPVVQPASHRGLAAIESWLSAVPPATILPFAVGIARPASPVRLRAPKGGLVVAGRFYKGGQLLPATAAPSSSATAANCPDSRTDRADERWAVAGPSPVASPTLIPPPALATTRFAIHGFVYTAREVPAGECGSVAFEVHRPDTNHTYHVIRDGFGEVTCSCPDFELRRVGSGQPCKHGRKLIELGLVAATTPCTVATAPSPQPRRFEPSPAEMAEAAQLFADLAGVC